MIPGQSHCSACGSLLRREPAQDFSTFVAPFFVPKNGWDEKPLECHLTRWFIVLKRMFQASSSDCGFITRLASELNIIEVNSSKEFKRYFLFLLGVLGLFWPYNNIKFGISDTTWNFVEAENCDGFGAFGMIEHVTRYGFFLLSVEPVFRKNVNFLDPFCHIQNLHGNIQKTTNKCH